MSNLSSIRPNRLKSSRYLQKRQSNSPTISTQSQKSLWARSYKNQPIPAAIRKRLIGKKYQFDDSDDSDDQEIMAVLEEQQQQQIQQKTKLSKFKVISDWGQFSHSRRNRKNSQQQYNYKPPRCHSVASFKLSQVLQQKKEQDENKNKPITKLSQFKDKNQFGFMSHRVSSSDCSDIASHVQSMEVPIHIDPVVPQQIIENQAQQTKSEKLHHQKSIITAQLQKFIVDQVQQKKRIKKQELADQQIITIIEQEKHECEVDTDKLSSLLSKFQQQSSYLNKINDQEDYSRKSHNQIQNSVQKQDQIYKNIEKKQLSQKFMNQIINQVIFQDPNEFINEKNMNIINQLVKIPQEQVKKE